MAGMQHEQAAELGVWLICPRGTPLYVETRARHYYRPEQHGDRSLVHVWGHDVDELLRRGFALLPDDEVPV